MANLKHRIFDTLRIKSFYIRDILFICFILISKIIVVVLNLYLKGMNSNYKFTLNSVFKC